MVKIASSCSELKVFSPTISAKILWTLQQLAMTSHLYYYQQYWREKHQIIFVTGVDETCMGHNNQKMEICNQKLTKKLFMKITWRRNLMALSFRLCNTWTIPTIPTIFTRAKKAKRTLWVLPGHSFCVKIAGSCSELKVFLLTISAKILWTLQRLAMTFHHHYCQQHRQEKHQIIFVTGVDETRMGHNNK